MQRNMDFVRELLLMIEGDRQLDGSVWKHYDSSDDFGPRSFEEAAYHLNMLLDAGFIKGQHAGQMPVIAGLTWDGHEFLDNIRDQGIWDATKKRIAGLSSVGLSVIAQLAAAEMKKHLGLS